jgi:hypothetical protein
MSDGLPRLTDLGQAAGRLMSGMIQMDEQVSEEVIRDAQRKGFNDGWHWGFVAGLMDKADEVRDCLGIPGPERTPFDKAKEKAIQKYEGHILLDRQEIIDRVNARLKREA